ncbi:MAG: hypothetical protein KKF68_00475 [Nanoarchaeota archaeon]|nr:hypothetical protein [Nanoarchaeota archaeon]
MKKNKKAVSIMIGYVLLITIAIIMSVVIYQWMRSYVPKDILTCPEEVSIYIKNLECSGTQLNLTLRNNGQFNIAGYFIHATKKPDQELATLDLSQSVVETNQIQGNAIIFDYLSLNSLKPNQEKTNYFNLNDTIYSLEITPVRYQGEENKMRLVNCGNSKVKESIICG